MFSTVESLLTNRASQRLVASSIMLISTISSPRPSNQAWMLVSHWPPVRWSPSRCCTRHDSALVFNRPAGHQFAKTAAAWTPFMDLLDLLFACSPQLRLAHP